MPVVLCTLDAILCTYFQITRTLTLIALLVFIKNNSHTHKSVLWVNKPKLKYCRYLFPHPFICMRKGYLPNLLETALLCQIFVFSVRDFKFWLPAYFLILFNCAKFQKGCTTFILDILQGSPL